MSAENPGKFDQEYLNYRNTDVAERISRAADFIGLIRNHVGIIYGPTFNVSTSNPSLHLNLDLLSENIDPSKRGHVVSRFYLIARSEGGEVLGMRGTQLTRGWNGLAGGGEVMTLPKIPGTGTVLELTNLFLIQNFVNLKGRDLTYTIDPAITRRLEQIAEMSESGFHYLERLSYFELYQRKYEEYRCWLTLFGNQGLLGLTNRQRTFSPSGTPIDLLAYQSISLDRKYIVTQTGRKLIQPVITDMESVEDREAFQTSREKDFVEVALPQLEEIASHKNDNWRIRQ